MLSAIPSISRLGFRSSASDRHAADESGFKKVAALLWRALTCPNSRVSNSASFPANPAWASGVAAPFAWKDISLILELVGKVAPRAQTRLALALSESRLWNKHPNLLIQFFQARKVAHLPHAQDLLKSLNIFQSTPVDPAAVRELCKLVQEIVHPMMMNRRALRSTEIDQLTQWMCDLLGAGKKLPRLDWLSQLDGPVLKCFSDLVKNSSAMLSPDHNTELIALIQKAALLRGIKSGQLHYTDLDEHVRQDKDIALAACSRSGILLDHVGEELSEDRDVVLAALHNRGRALEFVGATLKEDRDVVLAAVKNDGFALVYASAGMRADREVMMEAVKRDGLVLNAASEELRADREIAIAAVRCAGFSIMCCSPSLLGDRELVLHAVSQYGPSLAHASEELKDDKEVVIAALGQSRGALIYASERLKNDPDVQSTQTVLTTSA
jgi:hypothetical protein